jgi:hypothetical protein
MKALPFLFAIFSFPLTNAACGCTSDETCCADDQGYAGCIDQVCTFFSPNAALASHLNPSP